MNQLVLMIHIAGRRCVMAAHDVKSVIDLGAVAPVPQSPPFIAGITALRSQTLTVIDCRLALGLANDPWPSDSRAAVVGIDGHFYALVVDAIEDITTALSEPGEIPGGFGEEWSRAAHGMIETGIGPALLLNLPVLIAGPEASLARMPSAA